MEYDENKIDEMVLALLFLTVHDERRAWKGHDWDAMNRLHAKGYISNPATAAKSVALTEGAGLSTTKPLRRFSRHWPPCSDR